MGMDPLTMAIISGATTAAGISEQNKAAQRQQEAAVAQQNLMNQQRAQEMEEIKAEAGMEATQEARERLRERASIRAAQAESGVAGVSPLRELANVYMQEAIDTGTIISKEEADLRTTAMQSQSDYLSTVSTINQAESQKTTGLAAALQIGASGAQGYMMGSSLGGTTTATPSFAGEGLLTSPGSMTAAGATNVTYTGATSTSPWLRFYTPYP